MLQQPFFNTSNNDTATDVNANLAHLTCMVCSNDQHRGPSTEHFGSTVAMTTLLFKFDGEERVV